jgi:putative ABC transport system permease protein
LFSREGVGSHVVHEPDADVERLVGDIKRMLIARHGREDFTVTPQKQMLDVLDSVLQVLTFAVGALGGISLVVGGVGVLTIMTISVAERTAEIGLLRALGARRRQVLLLFLSEAILLPVRLFGLLLGYGLVAAARRVPALPVAALGLCGAGRADRRGSRHCRRRRAGQSGGFRPIIRGASRQ